MNFGNTAGNVGEQLEQGTNSGKVAVESQHNYDGRQMNFGNSASPTVIMKKLRRFIFLK